MSVPCVYILTSIAQKRQHHESGAERTAIIDFSPSQHASYRM